MFLTPSNIVTILKSISITTVIAMGATIGFATGVFDLSFATLATLGAALSVTFIGWYNMPMPVAMIAATLICMLVGVINAVVVVKFHVTAFLATLAMQFVLDGVILTYSGGALINPKVSGANGQEVVREVPEAFWNMGKSPYIIIIMFVCVIVVELFLFLYKAWKNAFIWWALILVQQDCPVLKLVHILPLAFVLTGLFSALSGMLIAARAGTVQSTAEAPS